MPQNKRRRNAHLTPPATPELPGRPGYRTREGRSGLDPQETYLEEAFMEGTFLRLLFTLRLRTRSPFRIAMLFFFGLAALALAVPFTVGLAIPAPDPEDWVNVAIMLVCVLGFPLAAGACLVANGVLSILHRYNLRKPEEKPGRLR